MILPIHKEKVFDKIQHLFLITSLTRNKREIYLIKNKYKTFQLGLILRHSQLSHRLRCQHPM